MNCQNCGREISENSIVCPWCGQEVQVVSAVDDLEEELLREMVDEDGIGGAAKTRNISGSSGTKTPSSDEKRSAAQYARKKKQRKRRVAIIIIILAAVCCGVFFGLRYHQHHSYDYLISKARSEYDQKDYLSSLDYLEIIDDMDEETEESIVLEADVCFALGYTERAGELYLRAIALYPDSIEAWQGILDFYFDQGDMEKILELKGNVTNPEILALFDDYLVPEPEFSVDSGTYDEYFTVKITAPKKGLAVYYTLDGSLPDENSEKYTSEIAIEEQGVTVLTAVCVNENGDFSEAAVAEYDIELPVPDTPTASPDGGTFTSAAKVTVTVPAGCTVYYTWDKTIPGEYSYKYTGPITIPKGNNVLSLVAIDANGMRSEVLKCNYIYYPETKSPSDTGTARSDTESETDTSEQTGSVSGQATVDEVQDSDEQEETDDDGEETE